MSPVFSTYNMFFIFSVLLNGILHPEKKCFLFPTMKHCIMFHIHLSYSTIAFVALKS